MFAISLLAKVMLKSDMASSNDPLEFDDFVTRAEISPAPESELEIPQNRLF